MKILIIVLIALIPACQEEDNRHCYECTVTFTSTGSANDGTKESQVVKCNVTEEDIREMERLAADTITSPDGVVVIVRAECK